MSVVAAEKVALNAERKSLSGPQVYFPGLTNLRFFAAMGVVVHHMEQIKGSFGLPNCDDTWFATAVGKEGVRLFFVLSGFLITYLMLIERDSTGGVDVKAFYKRRILRIWPLYFLVVLLSFVVLPVSLDGTGLLPSNVSTGMHALYDNFFIKLASYCAFLPNVMVYMYPPVYGGGHLWSIAVEEQFYVVWPLLMIAFAKAPLLGFAAILAAKLGALSILQGAAQTKLVYVINGCIQSNGVESFVIGGATAWFFLRRRERAEKFVTNRGVILLCSLGIAICLFAEVPHYVLIMNVCLAWLVAYQCTKSARNNWLDGTLRHLGTASYGIYMFHPVVIFVVLTFAHRLPPMNSIVLDTGLYVVVVALTILISLVSYRCFEKKFLKQKERLAVVQSRME